ncbi:MAG: DUF4870 domain-containing protein [Planctomycetes bacterium]|nr:DUF4870 domain-containing protein [Planctomycetota bacterium]
MAEKEENPEPDQQDASADQPQDVQGSPGSKELNKDARMWGMICHLAGLCGLIPIVPVIGSVIGPLIVWQMKKDEFGFVNDQGKEAVNFQISIVIYTLVSGLLCLTCIGIFLLPVVGVFYLVFLLIAAVKANNGEYYRYPLIFRFIK